MNKLNCLIIEDEPIAAEIVQSNVEQVSFLHLEKVCHDAITALEILNSQSIDVIFLDIHLPKLKGIDFLKTLAVRPKIIITSAYKQYALEGFELEITDYLLKPFSFERFLKAVNRLPKSKNNLSSSLNKEPEYRFFNVNKKQLKVYLQDILYIESLKDYVKIHTKEKTIVTKFQLGQLEEFLNNPLFVRIHRSFIVAKNKINSFNANEVDIAGKSIPIGRTYGESFKTYFEKNSGSF